MCDLTLHPKRCQNLKFQVTRNIPKLYIVDFFKLRTPIDLPTRLKVHLDA